MNAKEMLKTLKAIQPAVSNKELMEQADCVVFRDGRVFSFNDAIAISAPVEGIDFEAAVLAAPLIQFFNKTKEKEVIVMANKKKGEVLLKGKRAKAGIAMQEEIKLPIEDVTEPDEWHALPDNFTDALKIALPNTGTNMAQPILTCLLLKEDCVIASDDFRIAKCDWVGEEDTYLFSDNLLPREAAKELVKHPITEFALSEGWLHFRENQDGLQFSCRTYSSEYPDVAPFLEIDGEEIAFPKEIVGVMDRAEAFATGTSLEDEVATVTLKKGKIVVRGEAADGTTWYQESCKVDYDDEEIQFQISPSTIKEVVPITNTTTLGDNAIWFEGDFFVHVGCLIVGDEG